MDGVKVYEIPETEKSFKYLVRLAMRGEAYCNELVETKKKYRQCNEVAAVVWHVESLPEDIKYRCAHHYAYLEKQGFPLLKEMRKEHYGK